MRPTLSLTSVKVKCFKLSFMSERKMQVRNGGGGSRARRQPRRNRRKRNAAARAPLGGPRPGDQKRVDAPLARAYVVRTRKPAVKTFANGDARVVHREYIADVIGSNDDPSVFKVDGYPVNPGQATTFPWLSKLAVNYESYRFNKLRFIYQPIAPSTTPGTIMLTFDYDAQDPAPADKKQAASYRSTVRTAPWQQVDHVSKPEDLHKLPTNYVRPGFPPPGTDIKTYDIGNLFVISEGIDAKLYDCGELYAEYDVQLMTPVFETSQGLVQVGGTALRNGTSSAANPFGDGLVHVSASSYGFAMNNASQVTFLYPGLYLVAYSIVGTTVAATNIDSLDAKGTVLTLVEVYNAAATQGLKVARLKVNVPGAQYGFASTGSTTVTGAALWIGSAPDGSIV